MNILAKSAILILILFLSGCAHHSGYYSGRSNFGAVGISVDARIPLYTYSRHYDHDVYRPRSIRRKYRDYDSHHDSHRYGRHDYRHDRFNRYGKKHHSKHRYDQHYQDYSHRRRKKGRDSHWGGRASRHNYDRHR